MPFVPLCTLQLVPLTAPPRGVLQGTLRDQLIYPDTANAQDEGDAELSRLLAELGLGHLQMQAEGLDAVEQWDNMLSVGEQQRLGIARLLYHK